jgi:Protein of unknown function (DUF1360)
METKNRVAEAFDDYAPPASRPPMGSYAALTGIFGAGLLGFIAAARRNPGLPERLDAADTLLVGVGAHKLSRLIAKDKVTSFLRAPFRRYSDEAGPAELEEQTRGTGPRAAVGEMLGCPYCLDLWAATALSAGLVVAPRETRFVGGILNALTIADFMQVAYRAAQARGLG